MTHNVSGDACKGPYRSWRSQQFTVFNDEDVFANAFSYAAVAVKAESFVHAACISFDLCKDAVEVVE